MPNDIVVDTNVFMHAADPRNEEFINASEFVELFVNSESKLCFDEGFSFKESDNRSRIWSEYIKILGPMDFIANVIATLASSMRIKECSGSVSRDLNRFLNQGIPDQTDRIFAKVAINSDEKVLISDDRKDFPVKFRRECRRRRLCSIIDSNEAANLY